MSACPPRAPAMYTCRMSSGRDPAASRMNRDAASAAALASWTLRMSFWVSITGPHRPSARESPSLAGLRGAGRAMVSSPGEKAPFGLTIPLSSRTPSRSTTAVPVMPAGSPLPIMS